MPFNVIACNSWKRNIYITADWNKNIDIFLKQSLHVDVLVNVLLLMRLIHFPSILLQTIEAQHLIQACQYGSKISWYLLLLSLCWFKITWLFDLYFDTTVSNVYLCAFVHTYKISVFHHFTTLTQYSPTYAKALMKFHLLEIFILFCYFVSLPIYINKTKCSDILFDKYFGEGFGLLRPLHSGYLH